MIYKKDLVNMELDLHPISLEDKQWIDPIVFAEGTHSADFCFGNMFIWDDTYDQQVGLLNGRMIVLARSSTAPFFAYPIGSGDLKATLLELHRFAQEHHFPFTLAGVTEEHRALIEEVMPGAFEFQAEEQYFDYIYYTEKMATLSGKKLHGKRNHIHRFEERYPSWHTEPLTAAHFEECNALLERWQGEHEDTSTSVREEGIAIRRALQHYDALGLEGCVLYVEDRLCAFTLGELCGHDIFLTHFEKADSQIEGAYPMINRAFAKLIWEKYPNVNYINREDDLGIESLRKAKRSYAPVFLITKYTAHWKEKHAAE